MTTPETFSFDNVVGHDEVAVEKDLRTRGRKSDPGLRCHNQ